MSCLLMLIDACREDYISPEQTPFLHYLKSRGGYASLDFSSSFNARAELLTGNSSLTSDLLFDFCYDPKNSPFKLCRYLGVPSRKIKKNKYSESQRDIIVKKDVDDEKNIRLSMKLILMMIKEVYCNDSRGC